MLQDLTIAFIGNNYGITPEQISEIKNIINKNNIKYIFHESLTKSDFYINEFFKIYKNIKINVGNINNNINKIDKLFFILENKASKQQKIFKKLINSFHIMNKQIFSILPNGNVKKI